MWSFSSLASSAGDASRQANSQAAPAARWVRGHRLGLRRTAALTASSSEPESSGTEVSVLVSTSGSRARLGQALPRSRLLGFDPACPLERDWTGMRPSSVERRGSGVFIRWPCSWRPTLPPSQLWRPRLQRVRAAPDAGGDPRGRGSAWWLRRRPPAAANLAALAAPAPELLDVQPRAADRAHLGGLPALRVERRSATPTGRPALASGQDREALGLAAEIGAIQGTGYGWGRHSCCSSFCSAPVYRPAPLVLGVVTDAPVTLWPWPSASTSTYIWTWTPSM